MLDLLAHAILRRRLSLALALLLAVGGRACAQAPPDGGDTGMTLHVVVRELQVASLVLDEHRRPAANVDPANFRIQIERRPKFTPMRVHREGDDPFSLVVLLDVSHARNYLDQLPDALADMREKALLPHDRLIISAVDCKGVVYTGNTSTPEAVRTGVKQLLASGLLHDGVSKGQTQLCSDRARLWDEVAYSLRRVGAEPGRHAVLVVSEGYDAGSKSTLATLQEYATNIAGTIFLLPSHDMSGPNVRRSPLDYIVQLSGGVVLDPPGKEGIAKSFLDCVEMLRDRFILGFNQPSHLKVGNNALVVTTVHGRYDIRTSGVSTPGEVPSSDKAAPDAAPAQAGAAANAPHQP
jgi:hypothetical protein